LQIYCETLSLQRVNSIQKLPGILRLMLQKNWALTVATLLKRFAIGAFVEHIVVKRANDDLC